MVLLGVIEESANNEGQLQYWENHVCDAVDAANNESDLGLCC